LVRLGLTVVCYSSKGPLPFLLPWLRLEIQVRFITATMWDEQAWPVVRIELARALRMRAAVGREG
jgi:hypothetical protein